MKNARAAGPPDLRRGLGRNGRTPRLAFCRYPYFCDPVPGLDAVFLHPLPLGEEMFARSADEVRVFSFVSRTKRNICDSSSPTSSDRLFFPLRGVPAVSRTLTSSGLRPTFPLPRGEEADETAQLGTRLRDVGNDETCVGGSEGTGLCADDVHWFVGLVEYGLGVGLHPVFEDGGVDGAEVGVVLEVAVVEVGE